MCVCVCFCGCVFGCVCGCVCVCVCVTVTDVREQKIDKYDAITDCHLGAKTVCIQIE